MHNYLEQKNDVIHFPWDTSRVGKIEEGCQAEATPFRKEKKIAKMLPKSKKGVTRERQEVINVNCIVCILEAMPKQTIYNPLALKFQSHFPQLL